MAHRTVTVRGIHCPHCTGTIERELAQLVGVTSVKADAGSKQVSVTWQEEEVGWDKIQALLEEIGYAPES